MSKTLVIGSLNKGQKEDSQPFVKLDPFNGSLVFEDKTGQIYDLDYLNLGRPLGSKGEAPPPFVLNSVFVKADEKIFNVGSMLLSKKGDGSQFIKVDEYNGKLKFRDKATSQEQDVKTITIKEKRSGSPDFVLGEAVISKE